MRSLRWERAELLAEARVPCSVDVSPSKKQNIQVRYSCSSTFDRLVHKHLTDSHVSHAKHKSWPDINHFNFTIYSRAREFIGIFSGTIDTLGGSGNTPCFIRCSVRGVAYTSREWQGCRSWVCSGRKWSWRTFTFTSAFALANNGKQET
jgi:hypothetical protein